MNQIVRAAIVQAGSILFDTPATLERMAGQVAAAAGEGDVDLIVFPEAYVGGLSQGS